MTGGGVDVYQLSTSDGQRGFRRDLDLARLGGGVCASRRINGDHAVEALMRLLD